MRGAYGSASYVCTLCSYGGVGGGVGWGLISSFHTQPQTCSIVINELRLALRLGNRTWKRMSLLRHLSKDPVAGTQASDNFWKLLKKSMPRSLHAREMELMAGWCRNGCGAMPTAFSFAGTHRAIFGRRSPA